MIEQFGSRWALLVLLTLEQHGTLRYSALRRNIPGGISERMLAATLDGLEQSGLVDRTVYPEVPPRVEYRLTPKPPRCCPFCTNCSRGQRHTQSDAADPRNHPKMKSEARERQLKTPRKRTLTEVRTHIRRKRSA